MKFNPRIILSLICFALYAAPIGAGTVYWDVNGNTAGAGGASPSGTWDTGATANWSTDANGSSPTTTFTDNDDAIFSAGSDATGSFTVDVGGTPVVGNLNVEEGNATISGGTALNVGGGVALKGIIDVAVGSTLTINSVITGGDSSGTITKNTSDGTLVLSGANTYTGQTTLQAGTLSFNSIGDVNAGASSLGNPADVAAGTIKLGASGYETFLKYTGTGHNSDRVLNFASGDGEITIDASGSGPLVFTSATGITATGSGVHTFYLDGSNTDVNTITGPIANNSSGNYTKIAKYGQGTWALLGNSSFSGVFDIRFGTVIVNSLADAGSPSSLGTGGAGVQHAIIGFGGNGGDNGTNATLKYIGPGSSSSRRLRMYGIQGTPGGATIDASGTGALVLYGDLLRPAASQNDYVAKTLTLKGANTDANAFNGIISDWVNGPTVGKTFVTKDGSGTWILGGADTYTGDTTVKQGALLVNGSTAAGSAVNVNSGATLGGYGIVFGPVTVASAGTVAPGAPGFSIATLSLNTNLTLSGNLLIEVDKPSYDSLLVSGDLTNAGNGTVTVVNLGSDLAPGDTFQIFNKAMTNGAALAITGGNAAWTNKLWLDGSIQVLSISSNPPIAPATNVTIAATGPASFSLGGQGAANSPYGIYATTNIATPMSNWWLIGTTNSDGGGLIQFLDPQATNGQRFYRFGQTVTP